MNTNYSVICPGCNEVVDLRTDWIISADHCDDCELRCVEIPDQREPTDEELAEMAAYYEWEALQR